MKTVLPTSDLTKFQYQLNNPNKNIKGEIEVVRKVQRITKNIILSNVSDATGCGHIRCIFPMTYLNAEFGHKGEIVPFVSPFFIYQHDVLMRTRSILFQRTMNPNHLNNVLQYKELQKKYGYKMIYDIDDFIWDGKHEGEHIPDYNIASTRIGLKEKETAIKIMNLMDIVCVSTDFLKDYLINEKGVKSKVVVLQNTVAKHFWFNQGKRPKIKNKIEKPRIVYTGSPSHYCNFRKMKGDWDNAWLDWILKNVRDNKIDFMVVGGLPFFFESIKNKIIVLGWRNSYDYHIPIVRFRPDFGIAPLTFNYFNSAKSNLKLLEYSAVGAVAIGTTFTNGYPSPYDNNFVKTPDNISVHEIDDLFERIKEPDVFNDIIDKQYKYLDEHDHWLDSKGYINKLLTIF